MRYGLFNKLKVENDNTYGANGNIMSDETSGNQGLKQRSQASVWSEEMIPQNPGDYGKALFLRTNGKSLEVRNDNGYTKYILSESGIEKPSMYHRQMIEEGYLEKDSDVKALQSLKLDELRKIAKKIGIGAYGKKSEIAERIVESDNFGLIRECIPDTYSLSEKGRQFLDEHEDCLQVHMYKEVLSINWNEYSAEKGLDEGRNFYEVCSEILHKRAEEDTERYGITQYRQLAKLSEICKDFKLCLCYTLQYLYLNVSGSKGMSFYEEYKEGKLRKEVLKSSFSDFIIITGEESIEKYKEYYEPSIVDELYTWELPVMICEKQLFTEIVNDIMRGAFNRQTYEKELRVRYEKFIDGLRMPSGQKTKSDDNLTSVVQNTQPLQTEYICPLCNGKLRIDMEQVGVDSYGLPVYHRFAYCDNCMRKKDIEADENAKQLMQQNDQEHIPIYIGSDDNSLKKAKQTSISIQSGNETADQNTSVLQLKREKRRKVRKTACAVILILLAFISILTNVIWGGVFFLLMFWATVSGKFDKSFGL